MVKFYFLLDGESKSASTCIRGRRRGRSSLPLEQGPDVHLDRRTLGS